MDTTVDKFSLKVVNFKETMRDIEEEVLEKGTMGLHEKMDFATEALRRVTPVDTGKARKGWYNKKDTAFFSKHPRGGEIINPVEYVPELNNGHSKQAPKFFIEQVLMTVGLLKP